MTDKPLSGLRILVVEDNALLAMTVDSILRNAGAEVAGPVGTLSEAEQVAAGETLSGALLDIKLNSDEIWPVARILLDRGVPFIFCFSTATVFRGSGRPFPFSPSRPARARSSSDWRE